MRNPPTPCARPRRSQECSQGFTLLEIAVTLTILSVMAVGAYSFLRDQMQMQHRLEHRTFALFALDLAAQEDLLWPDSPLYTENTRRLTMGRQEWIIRREIEATADPALQRVTFSALLPDEARPAQSASEMPLLSLTTFRQATNAP